MATIVLTGSSGMVGSAVGERLLEIGHDVVGVDTRPNRWVPELEENTIQLDLLDANAFSVLPDDPDYLLHFAANSRVKYSINDPSLAMENVMILDNVLRYLRTTSDPKLLFASSREVYGEGGEGPTSEDAVTLEACNNPYGASKISNEATIYANEECYGIMPVILRFSNIYGKYDVSDRVIPKFILEATNDQDIQIYGEEKTLDFCYIEDCVDAVIAAVDRFDTVAGRSMNVGGGQSWTLVELANIIKDVTGSSSEIHVQPNREGEVQHFLADVSRAERLLEYDPDYTLEEGLRETVDWYQARSSLLSEIGE